MRKLFFGRSLGNETGSTRKQALLIITVAMQPALRRYFDELLEAVLADMPAMVQDALQDVPLIVEDFPPDRLLKEMNVERRDDLQGLYMGRDRFENYSDEAVETPDVIFLFREGILSLATDDDGEVIEAELREQIRITVMHEVGHYYGLNEEDLEQRGYD